MKTSNLLSLAAVALVLGSLATYDAALHAEYRTGHYKDPLYNYQTLGLRNFDAVSVPSVSSLNVRIESGPFAVRVSKEAAKYVHVTQRGQQLIVTVAYPEKEEWLGGQETVLITCPRLASLTTEGTYTVAGKVPLKEMRVGGEVEIKGFRQDSLTLRQDQSSQIRLKGNTLGWLRAEAGRQPSAPSELQTESDVQPELQIESDNQIQAANLTIGHRGKLALATAIPGLRYQFSDNAVVSFTGAAAHSLSTPK